MEGDARNENVVTRVGAFVLMRSGASKTATCGLEEEGEDIAGDEDARVRERSDSGVLGAESGDDAGEGQVETCSEEGGSDCEADDLNEVGVLDKEGELVVDCSGFRIMEWGGVDRKVEREGRKY